MTQIRLNKTPELKEVLDLLKRKYRLLSEAEIIKVALAEKYSKEANIPFVDEETEELIAKSIEDYKSGRYTKLRSDRKTDDYLNSL